LESYLKEDASELSEEDKKKYEKSDNTRFKHLMSSIDEKVELRKLKNISPLHIYYRSNPMIC